MMKPRSFVYAACVAVFAVGLPTVGCSREQPAAAPQVAASPVATVAVPTQSPEAQFPSFLQTFVREVLDGVDFNTLLRQQDSRLMRYVAPGITLHRYYNPGASCNDYTAPNWDFMPLPRKMVLPAGMQPVRGVPQVSCEDDGKAHDGLYYEPVRVLPTSIRMHEESWDEVLLTLPAPWQQAPLMHAVLYHQGARVKSLYFAHINGTWSLVLVDDCEPCSA